MCKKVADVSVLSIGSLVRIKQYCAICERAYTWDSQPYIGSIPAGNVLLLASILFSGSLPSKSLRIFQFLNCAAISESTFYNHQRRYLQPTINNIWKREQSSMLTVLQTCDQPLALGGDGRCDSPGFSAKYGCYTFMELEHNAVLHIELVQVCGDSKLP